MSEVQTVKERIVSAYSDFVENNNSLPTYSELLTKHDITRSQIRDQFGNLTNLHDYFAQSHSDVLDAHVGHAEYIFNEKRLDGIAEQFKDTKVFIITTAVTGKPVHADLLKTVKQYLDKRNGQLILITSEDIASRKRITGWHNVVVAKEIKDEYFVTKEFRLNSNLFISDIRVSAKQILPTTGLSRIGQTNGSYIFASPKQMLEFVATSPKDKYPKAVMTTGAITVSEYNNDRWMSQRTSYIAAHDHVMGGLIVEVKDDKIFHFRHFQANSLGEFVDLGVRYYPDGSTEKETTHIYGGDWHSGQADEEVVDATLKLCVELEVENFFTGDFFDGYAISHHHMNQPLKRATKALNGSDDLVEELKVGGRDVNRIHASIKGDLILNKGNHDEVLEKYLSSGNYTKDFKNQYVALELARLQIEGNDPLEEAYRIYGDIKEFERIVFLQRDDPYKIGGVECGQHGDLGANGSRGSLLSLEKAYGHCIVGHVHSAAIMRGVFRVGTLTKLSLEYNKGPSSWTHTNCLIYEDGSRQLINVINGETHLSSK